MKNSFNFFVLVLFLTYAGHSNATPKSQAVQLNEIFAKGSDCDKVKALIASHPSDFKQIRKTKTPTKLLDIWTVKYELIQKGCQVIRWKNNKYSYTCSLTSPGKAVALERLEKIKTLLNSCLTKQWQLSETQRSKGEGLLLNYTQKGNSTIISAQALETNGLFNSEWTNYLYIGDKEKIK